MKMVPNHPISAPITEKDIADIERTYRLKLPDDYRQFLLTTNGGHSRDYLDEEGLIIDKDYPEDTVSVKDFLGWNDPISACSINYWMGEYGDELIGDAADTLLIGYAHETGFFVLKCTENNQEVYYWDDCREFEFSSDEANAYWVADSFTEFIEKLGGLELVED